MSEVGVPALRFAEFEGIWEEKRLGELATVATGSTPPTAFSEYYDGPHLFVSPADITGEERFIQKTEKSLTALGFSKARTIPAHAILFVCIGSTIGKLAQSGCECATNQQINAVIANELNCPGFLFSGLERAAKSIKMLTAVQAVPIINKSSFSAIKIPIPTLPEQQKIADFLEAVDARVGLLRRRRDALRAYKKGMMQRLFSQELRFTKPDGSAFPDWQDKRLGEVAVSHNSGIYKKSDIYGEGANIIGVSDLFSISVVKGQEFRRVPLTEKEISENALNEGDILYAESSLVRKGIAKSVYVSKLGAGTAFAWHTRRYAVDAKQALAAYIYFYLESDRARRFIESVATQTALTGITTRDYFACPVSLPHPEEQQKIADTLTALDTKIDAVTAQMDAMGRFKKGLLQQMFV